MYVGKIHNYVYYINIATCFGSERPIFKEKRHLDRETHVTKLNYANMEKKIIFYNVHISDVDPVAQSV